MFYEVINDTTFLIRLEKGEFVIQSITMFCIQKRIKNAHLTAIGSVEETTLAHYNVNNKKYTDKKIDGIFEVTSLIGNVALFEDKPLLHTHVTLSDKNMNTIGGHMVEAKVSATVEVFLTNFSSNFHKKLNDVIGLKLWELSEKV